MKRLLLLTTFLACMVIATTPSFSDNISPLVSDTGEDKALQLLAISESQDRVNNPEEITSKLETLLTQWSTSSWKPWVELQLAKVYMQGAQYTRSISLCERLYTSYRNTKPLLAAWAKVILAENLEKTGHMSEAMTAYREAELFVGSVSDMGPVWYARHRAADHFLRMTKNDPAHPDHPTVLSFDASDANAWAWAHSAICAQRVWFGEAEAAYKEFDELKAALPVADRRGAIAGIDLAISVMGAYDAGRTINTDILIRTQNLIRDIEVSYPSEIWLLAKGKLRMAQFLVDHNIRIPDAERYLQEVINIASNTDLLPEAYARLAQLLYMQGRKQEAIQKTQLSVTKYPYSQWTQRLGCTAKIYQMDDLMTQKRFDEAISTARQLVADQQFAPVSLSRTKADIQLEIAVCLSAQGKFDEAITEARKVSSMSGGDKVGTAIGILVGDCYKSSGRLTEAAEAYQSVVTSRPNNKAHSAVALFRRAICLYEAGKLPEAKLDFERLLDDYDHETDGDSISKATRYLNQINAR